MSNITMSGGSSSGVSFTISAIIDSSLNDAAASMTSLSNSAQSVATTSSGAAYGVSDVEGSMAGVGSAAAGASSGLTAFNGDMWQISQAARMSGSGIDRLQISQLALDNAQARVQNSAIALKDALEKYGAGSDQATRATTNYDIALRSEEVSQNRYNVRLIFLATTMIPMVITNLTRLASAYQLVSEEASTANIAMLAGPVGALLMMGVMAGLMTQSQTPSVNPMGLTPMQSGGIVRGPTPILAGEGGPEAIVPLGSSGAGSTVNIFGNQQSFSRDMDLQKFGAAMLKEGNKQAVKLR